jgi:hypothetical protein
MPLNNTTYKYQYGIAISEIGLNKISKALRATNPALFAKSTQIPIKAATATEPAHILTLYAMVDTNSLFFDFQPLQGADPGKPGSLSIQTHVDFSLTDNGLITRIGVDIKAIASVVRDTTLKINLLDFQIVKIVGEAPDFSAKLIKGAVQAGAQIAHRYNFDNSVDRPLADSFTAIVNYLIDVFLKDGLSQTIVDFPIPDLKNIIKYGNIVFSSDELRGPFIQNNTFYTMLGADLGTPAIFPLELTPPADIRSGISKSGLERIANGILPYKIPTIDLTHPYNTFYFHVDNLQITSMSFDITPGSDAIGLRTQFGGALILDIQFTVPVINKDVDIKIPILPLSNFSTFSGKVTPYIQVDPATSNDAKVHVHLIPHLKFLDDWYIFVVTDYRDYLANAIRSWVRSFGDNYVVKFLKHIPIIGWILSWVFDGAAWILGYLLGAFLDFMVTTTLNLFLNTVVRALVSIFLNLDFDVYKLPQAALKKLTGLAVGSGQVLSVDNGRDGELEIRLLFDNSIPPIPINTALSPISAPIPNNPGFPASGLKQNKEYAAADFTPALALGAPTFVAASERFSIISTVSGTVTDSVASINFIKTGTNWMIQKTSSITGSSVTDTATVQYDPQGKPISLIHTTVLQANISYQISINNDYTQNKATATANLNSNTSTNTVSLLPTATPEIPDFWIFRLAYGGLKAGDKGIFSRLDISSNYDYSNWARLIPVEVTGVVAQDLPVSAAVTLKCLKINAADELGLYEIIVLQSGGLYSAAYTQGGDSVIIKSI